MTDPDVVDADGTSNQQDGDGADTPKDTDLPREVVDEVERLTRLERTAVDENEVEAYENRSDELLDEHDFTSRIRNDDGDDVLVLHPEEWHEDGVIRTDRIEDIDRAVEIPLEGPRVRTTGKQSTSTTATSSRRSERTTATCTATTRRCWPISRAITTRSRWMN